MQRISLILYIVGSLLVFGSWMDIVPGWLGWCGWFVALFGWAVTSFGRRGAQPAYAGKSDNSSKADEIAKLDLLRKEGILTEEEFQQEKQRILHPF